MKRSGFRLTSLLLSVLILSLLFSGCHKNKAPETSTADLASAVETFASTAAETASEAEKVPETAEVPPTEQQTSAPAETTAEAATETAAATTQAGTTAAPPPETTAAAIDENGKYYSKDEVALYIHTYGHLPDNFVTKKEAKAAGWDGGSVEAYFPGCAIGGDYFGNYEGLLPKKKGRSYYECDIDTLGRKGRGAKRIIYSNDGLIYYTDDHYESFTQLYSGVAE